MIVVNLLFIIAIISFYIATTQKLNLKDSVIQNLQDEKTELENKNVLLEADKEKLSSFLTNISEAKESELKNPTWEELKIFLDSDDTNKLVYNKSFDCTGFAIELFKRTRDTGLRCGLVEVEYEENTTGHMLNVFQTVDKGLAFIDVTGNENGRGLDKIAYVEVGKPYGIIYLKKVNEQNVNCDVTCSQLTKEMSYVNYPNIFSYDYFASLNKCINFYKDCIKEYNNAVAQFNRGNRTYSFSELQKWGDNLNVLGNQLTLDNFYIISESKVVKNINIYW
jgi:hypothetical protein